VPVTYTAPSVAGVYTITATSVSNSTTSASLVIGVTDLSGVLTYHNNLSRDGASTHEFALTTSTVTTATFGKLFSCTTDGAIYTQPLWIPNLTVAGAKRNLILVATQHDSLYAFDADTTPCTTLWHANLLDSAHGGTAGETSVPSSGSGALVGGSAGDIAPEVGVTGTPVIDPTTNTLYVVSKSVNASTQFFQRLHGIDILTGNEKTGSPLAIAATYPGTGDGGSTVTFNPATQNQRPGLALLNGTVYIAWASHEDKPPYYGWVIGYTYNGSSFAQCCVLNVTPNVGYGGIWMGGGAPAADSNNHIYLITGNGIFDATNSSGPTNDYGDSFLQLSAASLAITSYFTPSDQLSDNSNDFDFGAGGSAVVLNLTSGPLQHLVIGGGKDGTLYLLNGDSMGGLGDTNSRQNFNIGSGIFATGAFWNNNFYIAGVFGPLLSYSFNSSTNLFNIPASSQSSTNYRFPGVTPSVSSSGATNGIVWALDNANYCTNQSLGCGPAVLHAYDATHLSSELWNSAQASGDAAGNAVKFTVPTVANGKVYVGTRGNNTGGVFGSTSISGELDVYGLKPN
jgi:hypothetical protein